MLSELISLARKYGCFIFSLEIFIHESTALKRRSARSRPKPGTRVLIPTGYLHPSARMQAECRGSGIYHD
jgi:predicted kinase